MTQALALSLDLEHFQISATGLKIKGDPTIPECETFLEMLKMFEHGIQLAIGDLVNYLEGAFGEKASQIVDQTGFSLSTVRVYSWVAKSVPEENRIPGASFSHLMEVAAQPVEDQKKYLQQAVENKWSVSKLKQEVAVAKGLKARWLLMIECDSEAELEALADRLEKDGKRVRRLNSNQKEVK